MLELEHVSFAYEKGINVISDVSFSLEKGEAVGLVGALFALFAFIIGMIALAKRESRYRLCVAAAIISGLMMIIWLTVFLNGIR